MKNFLYLVVAVCVLSLGFNTQQATAQYGFGDDVDSVDFGSDGSIKLTDPVDSIDVGGTTTNSSGDVELKNVKLKDSVDSIKVESINTTSTGNVKVQNAELNGDIKVQNVETNEEDSTFEITIDTDSASVYTDSNSSVTSASEVKTADDLTMYVAGTVKDDEALQKVNFKNDNLEVEYGLPGRLFALIPINIPYKVSVDSSTNAVSVKLPWWQIFATKKVKAAKVSSELKTELKANAPTITGQPVSLSGQAKIKAKAGTFSIVIETLSTEVK
ncbi:MAG: hypothetical protein WCT44_02185 [Candidatus Paceibacterota bacterium]